MGNAAIFAGQFVKLLKGNLNLQDNSYLLTGTTDPTSTAIDAPSGSLYLRSRVESSTPVSSVYGYLGSVLTNNVVIQSAYGPSGHLYVVGAFTTIGGTPANRVAKWNGSTWSALGSGLANSGRSVIVDSNENVYVGDSAGGVYKWNGSAWTQLGVNTTSPSASINCMAIHPLSGELYIGGSFGQVNNSGSSNYIAKWDGSTWVSIGASSFFGNVAYSMSFNPITGDLYVCGMISQIGGVSINYLAKWNGSTWSAVGTGAPNNEPRSLDHDSAGNLYVGGLFTVIGGISVDRAAKWDGSVWTNLTGFAAASSSLPVYGLNVDQDGLVWLLVSDTSNTKLIKYSTSASIEIAAGVINTFGNNLNRPVISNKLAGGRTVLAITSDNYIEVNGTTIPRTFEYSPAYSLDTSTPSGLYRKTDNGLTKGWRQVRSAEALSVVKSSGLTATLAGGSMYLSDGRILSTHNGSGTTAASFEIDINYTVAAGSPSDVYLYLDLNTLSSTIAITDSAAVVYPITSANIVTLTTTPENTDRTRYIHLASVDRTGGNLVITNSPQYVKNIPAVEVISNKAKVNRSNININDVSNIIAGTSDPRLVATDATSSSLYLKPGSSVPEAWGAMATTPLNGLIQQAAIDSLGNLYVVGFFTAVDGVSANRIAKWNGSAWSALGTGLDSGANSLAIDSSNNIYVVGSFTTAGGVSVNKIAKWNGSSWSAVGSGVGANSDPQDVKIDSAGNVYIAGYFTSVDGVSANKIAKWNGSTWSALGTGLDGNGLELAIDSSNNVYVAGQFSTAGGVSITGLAKWNGSTFSALGSGLNGHAWHLKITSSGDLYASGPFTTAGGVSANRIVKWNGSAWSALGTGLDPAGIAYDFELDYDNNLIIGGNFSTAGGVSANRIAKWNGSTWSALGTGPNNSIAKVLKYQGNILFGGYFTTINGSSYPYLAKYTPPSSIPNGIYKKEDSGSTTNWTLISKPQSNSKVVTQASHGFSLGNILYYTGSAYAKAIATSENTSEVVGIVSEVLDTNRFEITFSGEVSGLSSLTAGSAYFLSADTAGSLTATSPSTITNISVPVGVATSSTTLAVDIKRGIIVGGTNATTSLPLTNNNTVLVQDVSGMQAGTMSGWISIDGTTDYRFHFSAPFARNGANTDWNISPQFMGDVPPVGFAMSITSAGLINVTLPSIAGFVGANINYSINSPAIGAVFPLNISATLVNLPYTTVSTATTLSTDNYYVSAIGGTAFNITLPSATGIAGRVYIIKSNMNLGVLVNIDTTSSQTIDGALVKSLSKYESVQLISNGSNWEIF
jgi:hypothetical protein